MPLVVAWQSTQVASVYDKMLHSHLHTDTFPFNAGCNNIVVLFYAPDMIGEPTTALGR